MNIFIVGNSYNKNIPLLPRGKLFTTKPSPLATKMTSLNYDNRVPLRHKDIPYIIYYDYCVHVGNITLCLHVNK